MKSYDISIQIFFWILSSSAQLDQRKFCFRTKVLGVKRTLGAHDHELIPILDLHTKCTPGQSGIWKTSLDKDIVS